MDESHLVAALHLIARALEVAGTLVIALGAILALGRFIRQSWMAVGSPLRGLRSDLGGGILFGLELMVAAGIINTVAVEPTLRSLAVLAGVVAIRTFLSFSLQVELEGAWPWAKASHRLRQRAKS